MKNIGLILVSGVTLPILLLLGVFLLWPQQTPTQPAFVINIDEEVAEYETLLAERETPYQKQLQQLNEALQQQQADFERQTQSWQERLARTQAQLAALQQQEKEQQTEITRLETIHMTTLATYQTQLEVARQQTESHLSQLNYQLEEKKAALVAAQAQVAHGQ